MESKMIKNQMYNEVVVCCILSGCKVEAVQKVAATVHVIRPFLGRIIAIRTVLEEQYRAVKWIVDRMNASPNDSVRNVGLKDDVLRREFRKNVEIIEAYHGNIRPMELLRWGKNQFVEHMCCIEGMLSPIEVFCHAIQTSTEQKMRLPQSLAVWRLDEKNYEVERDMAFKSHLIRQLTGVIGSCTSTELSSNVHPTILKKVTEFLKPYEDNIIAGGYLNAAQLTQAIDHMEIADLVDLACQIFDPLIKLKNPEEIRKLVNITCFQDDEENEPKKSRSVGLPDMDDDILKGIQQLTTDSEATHVPFTKEVVKELFT